MKSPTGVPNNLLHLTVQQEGKNIFLHFLEKSLML